MSKAKPKVKKLKGKTILHILTGSIAAYKAGDLIGELRDHGARVVCVMTEGAKHFVTPLVIRALSGERVYHDFFDADSPFDVLHTSLAEEADAVLIAPASADFLAKMAAGLADDLASCILLATTKPVVIAPAMNDQMYEHPITQRNIGTLKSIGHQFIEPIEGHLVCGKEAVGHIADADPIIKGLQSAVSSKRKKTSKKNRSR